MSRLITLLLVLATVPLSAQQLFNVRIGTFQDVKADDFGELRELGFVYGLPLEDQLTDVYIGNYSTEERAAEVTADLQRRGFRNAAPFARPVAGTETATYVQVALRNRGSSLRWDELERAGRLFVEASDGVTKVVAGPYPDAAAANAALARIRELGYTDAFTRSIKTGNLVPVGVFETGIKKPLIPIDLTRGPEQASVPETPPSPAAPAPASAAPAPDTVVRQESVKESAVASMVRPVPVSLPDLPVIDVGTKRHSAAELQRVLKEKGFYDGSIDGFYGPGTEGAFEAAWNGMEELRNYRLIAGSQKVEPTAADPRSWPEVLVMDAIAEDMAAGLANLDRDAELAGERKQLFAAKTKLAAAASSEARSWETTVWDNLNDWATEDPLHARILSALRVAYYQSQVRLEAMYQERDLSAIEARDLATATLRNLLAGDLDRFL